MLFKQLPGLGRADPDQGNDPAIVLVDITAPEVTLGNEVGTGITQVGDQELQPRRVGMTVTTMMIGARTFTSFT